MKEDKFIDSLFEAAKKEPPKMSMESVSSQFNATVSSTNWWMAAKSAVVGNIYLNTIISAVVVGSLAISVYTVNAEEDSNTTSLKANEMAFSQWTQEETSNLDKAESVNVDSNLNEQFKKSVQTRQKKSPTIANKQSDLKNNMSIPNPLKTLSISQIPIGVYEKEIDCDEIEILQVIQNSYKYVIKKDKAPQLHCTFDKNATMMETEELLYYMEMNGINVDLRAKYDKLDETIKRLEIELSDNEGYIQRIVSIGFDVLEFYWNVDANGYPYNVQIAWDNGDLIDVDLTDQKVPLYKYVDRN